MFQPTTQAMPDIIKFDSRSQPAMASGGFETRPRPEQPMQPASQPEGDLDAQIKAIYADPNMSQEQKQEMIKKLIQNMQMPTSPQAPQSPPSTAPQMPKPVTPAPNGGMIA